MFLSLVEIRNFRTFEAVDVRLQKGLNVLVGRNNTGKTNILEAIRLALGPNASSGDPIRLDRDDFHKSSSSDESERTLSITLTFSDLDKTERAFFYEIVDFNLEDIRRSKAIIKFEATWPKKSKQPAYKRVGGPTTTESSEVPTKILSSLPITFLPALRDAEACLSPGRRSRLAQLLREAARKRGQSAEVEIIEIFKKANRDLEGHDLVHTTKTSLQKTTKDLAGTDYSPSAIRAADVEFEKILRSLMVQMDASPISALEANGLGYNNLLYVAVVLEYLRSPDPEEFPLLLVEEPEAHLHPQLTVLLADYLAFKTPGITVPQTVVTTHSPTLAASVPITRVNVLFSNKGGRSICNSLADAGMDTREQDELQRMMDVTRATLYFAKGIILVEGISEALLFPALAKRLQYDLAKDHISVIPICGVGFETFKKLFGEGALAVPVSIVTDADPPVVEGTTWEEDNLQVEDGTFKVSERATNLLEVFAKHPNVNVFVSQVTLEYDLALAGSDNCSLMASAWEAGFTGTPKTFCAKKVLEAGTDLKSLALTAWRGICRADHSGSKAQFSQRLAARLLEKEDADQGSWKSNFVVPQYIQGAMLHVGACKSGNLNGQPGNKSTDI